MSAPPVEVLDGLRPSQPTTPFSLGFKQPEETEEPGTPPLSATIPNPATSPESTLEPDEAPASELDDWPDEASENPADTSSKGSTPASNRPVSDGLRDFARNGVIIASAQAHQYLGSKTPGQRAVGLYAADEDDAVAIADPLARIAARRDGVGEMSPDTQDLLAAMMGIAGYAAKQAQKAATARKIDARELGVDEGPVDL